MSPSQLLWIDFFFLRYKINPFNTHIQVFLYFTELLLNFCIKYSLPLGTGVLADRARRGFHSVLCVLCSMSPIKNNWFTKPQYLVNIFNTLCNVCYSLSIGICRSTKGILIFSRFYTKQFNKSRCCTFYKITFKTITQCCISGYSQNKLAYWLSIKKKWCFF